MVKSVAEAGHKAKAEHNKGAAKNEDSPSPARKRHTLKGVAKDTTQCNAHLTHTIFIKTTSPLFDVVDQ